MGQWLGYPSGYWHIRGAPRDLARLDISPQEKTSNLFHCIAGTLGRELVPHRKAAIAKAFLARQRRCCHTSPIHYWRSATYSPVVPGLPLLSPPCGTHLIHAPAIPHFSGDALKFSTA